MSTGMGKINFEKPRQAMNRKGLDNALETKKKKLKEVSLPISFERTPTTGSSQSPILVGTPMFAPFPSMISPTRSSKVV